MAGIRTRRSPTPAPAGGVATVPAIPAEPPVVRGYDEYDDLPEGATVQAYSLEEIAAEKVVALGDRARNEPRDVYDIWYVTTEGHVDLAHLRGDVEAKLEFRGKKLSNVAGEFKRKEARLDALWSKRLAAQMAELPEFEGVFRAVQRALRQAALIE